MKMPVERYIEQKNQWPQSGKHILASFDSETIVVYQAYSSEIGRFAAQNGYFGGGFSYSRMSWIKPNFLWMMYRSNWGQSASQEVVLAIRIRRLFFDKILEQAVSSSYDPAVFATREEWQQAVERSDVRLQWDPDHLPNGAKEERRAIQLGLRGAMLESFGKKEVVEIVDISEFVACQYATMVQGQIGDLYTPLERPYRPNGIASARIGLD
ncbi:MAG: DUF4291 domain-containing protein [Planctomycetaceae bacterium]